MSVPVAEARTLYKTVSTCYRELYQAHGYFWSVHSLLQTCSKHDSTPRTAPVLRHLRRVLTSADRAVSSNVGADGKAPVDGKALVLFLLSDVSVVLLPYPALHLQGHMTVVYSGRSVFGRYSSTSLDENEPCSQDSAGSCQPMLIQTTATWLHILCGILCACLLPNTGTTSELSAMVERVFPTHLDPPIEAPQITQARNAFRNALVAAVSTHSNTADFQAALAKAVPLQLPLITSSVDRAELLLLLGRLLSNMSDVVEGELRKSLSWLDANSQELHREVAQKARPLQQQLEDIKTAVACIYGTPEIEKQHWDKAFLEELHNMHKSCAEEPSCLCIGMDAVEAADILLQRLRTSEHVPVCPITGLPYNPSAPTSPTNSTNELQNNCRAVSLASCGCCMSVYAARHAISARKCPLCSGPVLPGSGYKDNACMTRAAQAWAADLNPRQLAESDLEVYLDAKLRLPPRAVADGTLFRGKLLSSGEALAVMVVPLESAVSWERAAVCHALVVTAAAAALTPLLCTLLGVCWRANDVLIAYSGEFLIDGSTDPEDGTAEGGDARSPGTLTSATQLIARISVECSSTSSPPGLHAADALELGLSITEVQAVACENELAAAPHPSLMTLSPDNIFFTADGCSVRVPFLSPLSLPCVPPKTALRLREVAAKLNPMPHSATRSPSTRYTAPEVVNSTSLDDTASFGNTQALAAPVAAAVQSLDVEKAVVYTVGAVLQFCISGQAPKSAEELLHMSNMTSTLPMGNTGSIHEAASMHLHATSDLTLRMATQVTRTTDHNIHMRPNLDELQNMLLGELYALKSPLGTIVEGETEDKTSGSVEPGGLGGSRRSSHLQLSGALHGGGPAAAEQSAESLKSGSDSSSQRSATRLRPAWNRAAAKGRHTLPQPQMMQPHVFVPQQLPDYQPPPPRALSTQGSEIPPATEETSNRVDTGLDGGSTGGEMRRSLGEDTVSQTSTAQGTTERSVTGATASTTDFRLAEFKPTEMKPWESMPPLQPAPSAARAQVPPKPPLAHSRQPSREGLADGAEQAQLATTYSAAAAAASSLAEPNGVRGSAFDAQSEPQAQVQGAARVAASNSPQGPLASPQVPFHASASPRFVAFGSPQARLGLGSRNSSFGALVSPQASFDARSRPDSFASGEEAIAGPGASLSPRHVMHRSSSGSKKVAKTLQQLIEKINTEAKGTVVDLAGRSYKPAKGWFSALSNLSRLSSTPTLSSRASVPIPFPNDDNSDMMIAPEDMQLYQTPINDSEPGFDARAIFQLQMIQDPARRSQGASKLLHVASAHTTLVNGKLYLPAGGQLVLGPECQQLCFQDVTIKDGTILCHGRGCKVRFTNCILEATQVIVVGGAFVSINGQPQQAQATEHQTTSCIRHSTIAVFAYGAGTQVSLKDLLIEHCQQAVCSASGALVDMQQVNVSGMNITGCEVRGPSSLLSMQSCRVSAATAPAQPTWRIQGIWAHSGAKATVSQCTIERIPNGVAADSHGTKLAVSESWIRGNAACGIFVGYGARAEIHLSSLDVHNEAQQFIGLDVIGHQSHVTVTKSTARGNGGYGVHVSDHACVVADNVSTEDNSFGAWLVEGQAQAALESCKSNGEAAYCCKQGGSIKTVLCSPDFQ